MVSKVTIITYRDYMKWTSQLKKVHDFIFVKTVKYWIEKSFLKYLERNMFVKIAKVFYANKFFEGLTYCRLSVRRIRPWRIKWRIFEGLSDVSRIELSGVMWSVFVYEIHTNSFIRFTVLAQYSWYLYSYIWT